MVSKDRSQDATRGIAGFSYVAGELALDFTNTLGDRGTERPLERLREYADLVWWSYGADLVGGRAARRLLTLAQETPQEAAKVTTRAQRLREALHRAFAAQAAETRPAQDDLDVLNDELARALPRLSVQPGGDCCTLTFDGEAEYLDRPIWSVARSAVDLLTSPRVARVKQCAGHNCDWLFLDESRNHSRRWCSMSECGNRSKARRHYVKRKKQRSPSSSS